MRALEDLANAVRDPQSRKYLSEAVRAYQAGAFRSAIVSTWVAVALDLVAKIRELAEMGEAAAAEFINEVDNAIERDKRDKLMKVERDLLDTARNKFELLDQRELEELNRLRNDRHVCAHPAFVQSEQVFEPTPENFANESAEPLTKLKIGLSSFNRLTSIVRFNADLRTTQ